MNQLISMTYGTVTTSVVYKQGIPVSNKQVSTTIIKTPTKKILLDTIFDQLEKLQQEDSIMFEIFANPHSHEPARIEVTSKTHLD